MSSTLSEAKLKEIKRRVLERHVQTLANDLGTPVRYFPALSSAGLLTLPDREAIEHKVTTQEKVHKLVDVLSEGRESTDGQTPFDVLVDVLKRGGVHASVARGLEKALDKAVEEALDKADEEALDKADEEALDKADEEALDRAVEEALDRAVEEALDRAVEEAQDRAVEKALDRAVEEALDRAVEEAQDRAVKKALNKAVAEALDKAVEETLPKEETEKEADQKGKKDLPVPHSDGMETESFSALNRGSHTPQLKLDLSEEDITTPQPQDYKQPIGLEYYPMTGKKHGVCLIINNVKFAKESYRKGSSRDEHNLVQTWLYLGYRVEVRRNCTLQQIQDFFKNIDGFLNTLNESVKEEERVESDSFVCCILSHGDKHTIMSSDSRGIKVDDIERMIGKSKTLRSKPKLFFVQSCRGSFKGSEIESDGRDSRSDIYFSYATALGDKAYRDPTRGAWFVTELCKILCEHATSSTLGQMQHKLNAAVPANEQYTVLDQATGKEYTQQPTYAGSLTSFVHFFDSTPSAPIDSTPEAAGLEA